MLSALTITPPARAAMSSASADLPLAVGPAISTGVVRSISSGRFMPRRIRQIAGRGERARRKTVGGLHSVIEIATGFGHLLRQRPKKGARPMPADTSQTTFRRVMLKISGEALMGDAGYGLNPPTVERIAREVKSVHDMGVEICMVIGGGNIFRGLQGSAQGMERATADYMGMLATVMNALAMQGALEKLGIHTRVISAIPMDQVCEPYIRRRAVRHLEKKRVVIFAAGTGNPYFTTDTAAALRANEMACQAILMGKNGTDGVYDKDPRVHSDARRYDRITYDEVLSKHLKVMDASAIALARENRLPIIVFPLDAPGGFKSILAGQGT